MIPPAGAVGTLETAIVDVESGLGALFGRVRALMRQSAASMHPELQPGSYKALAHLARNGPLHAGELAADLAVDKSVLSRQMRQLEQLDLVHAAASPDDGRVRVYTPTPTAIERFRSISAHHQRAMRAALGEFSTVELATFSGIIERLCAVDLTELDPSISEADAATAVAASAHA